MIKATFHQQIYMYYFILYNSVSWCYKLKFLLFTVKIFLFYYLNMFRKLSMCLHFQSSGIRTLAFPILMVDMVIRVIVEFSPPTILFKYLCLVWNVFCMFSVFNIVSCLVFACICSSNNLLLALCLYMWVLSYFHNVAFIWYVFYKCHVCLLPVLQGWIHICWDFKGV